MTVRESLRSSSEGLLLGSAWSSAPPNKPRGFPPASNRLLANSKSLFNGRDEGGDCAFEEIGVGDVAVEDGADAGIGVGEHEDVQVAELPTAS